MLAIFKVHWCKIRAVTMKEFLRRLPSDCHRGLILTLIQLNYRALVAKREIFGPLFEPLDNLAHTYCVHITRGPPVPWLRLLAPKP